MKNKPPKNFKKLSLEDQAAIKEYEKVQRSMNTYVQSIFGNVTNIENISPEDVMRKIYNDSFQQKMKKKYKKIANDVDKEFK